MSLTFSLCLTRNKTLTPSEKLRLIFKHGGIPMLAQVFADPELWDYGDQAYLNRLREDFPLNWAKEEISNLKDFGAWATYLGADTYPASLSQISNPPIVLFGLGRLPAPRYYRLGFVGPRKPTAYGSRVARWLATELVAHEFVLVSGLAKGIDAIAHNAAVEKSFPTLAILAHGLDTLYPREHESLKEAILETGGALLTEFSLGTRPMKHHFPVRNRIISGLSSGVVVVEASQISGAKITANYAVDQGREVYAVPGPIDSPTSAYTNQLVADGAKMVTSAQSVLDDFSVEKTRVTTKSIFETEVNSKVELSKNELLILRYLENSEAVSVDEIAFRSKKNAPYVLEVLASLELKGVILQQGDARYVRKF